MTPKEVRQLWVKALRSGEYKQGKECLKTVDGKYCCLGVLTDLALKNGVIPEWMGNLILDSTVSRWAGLRNRNGWFGGCEDGLSYINDKTEEGFGKIADIIEAEPEGLLT